MILLPFLSSAILGFLALRLILKSTKPNFLTQVVLGWGLGLGLSANVLFYGFVLFGQLAPAWIWSVHTFLLIGLVLANIKSFHSKAPKKTPDTSLVQDERIRNYVVPLLVLALLSVPVWLFAVSFPNGGWDAWGCWNLKAKFLYLGEEHWQNMLLPLMWRSSPHYPLLLPLINVWGWLWTGQALYWVPLITSVLFTLLTAGLSMCFLATVSKGHWTWLSGAVMLSLTFFVQSGTSQYCDIVVAFYLLAALICLIEAKRTASHGFAFLAGLFCGLLSFSKSEGLVAAVILIVAGIIYLRRCAGKTIILFLIGCALTFAASFLFKYLYSPGNQTFINGLTSSTHPATWERLKIIGAYFGLELISLKWNGLWLLITLGIVLGWKRSLDGTIWIIPCVLLGYLAIVMAYYFVNTQFEILWWMQSSLSRILFALVPSAVVWSFYAMSATNKKP